MWELCVDVNLGYCLPPNFIRTGETLLALTCQLTARSTAEIDPKQTAHSIYECTIYQTIRDALLGRLPPGVREHVSPHSLIGVQAGGSSQLVPPQPRAAAIYIRRSYYLSQAAGNGCHARPRKVYGLPRGQGPVLGGDALCGRPLRGGQPHPLLPHARQHWCRVT